MAHSKHFPLTKSLQAGIIAGFISTAIGNFLGVVTHGISGTYYVETSIAAVTVAAMSFGIVASIIYHFLHQMTDYSRDFLTILGLTIPTMISIYVLTNDYYDTIFKVIAISISYAVVLTTVILIPWLSNRHKEHHAKKSS